MNQSEHKTAPLSSTSRGAYAAKADRSVTLKKAAEARPACVGLLSVLEWGAGNGLDPASVVSLLSRGLSGFWNQ